MKIKIFNPFIHIAGAKALTIGMAVIFLSGVLGYFSGTHFDGVIDAHIYSGGTILTYLAEGLINLVSLTLVFTLCALIFVKLRFRFIDLIGTLALARVPLVLIPLTNLVIPQQKTLTALMESLRTTGQLPALSAYDIITSLIFSIISIVTVVWMVILVFNAYRIVTNLRQSNLVMSFIIGILLAEMLSKYLIAKMPF